MGQILVTCVKCGKKHETTKYKAARNKRFFCSRDCFDNLTAITGQCDQCGETIRIQGYQIRRYENHFCGTECQKEWRKSIKVEMTCLCCGIVFLVFPSVANKGEGKYCSNKCHAISMDTRINKECPVCKESFLAKPCNIERGKDIYCSNKCALRGKERTGIEIAISQILDHLQIEYIEQFPVGRYICDFYVPQSNLIIEADGEYWHSLRKVKISDNRKNLYLKSLNYALLRIDGKKIRTDVEWCKRQILKNL